jgi:hypothetical protein
MRDGPAVLNQCVTDSVMMEVSGRHEAL